jgi:hypothetical protein
MGKPVKIGQSHTAMSILANNADWESIDSNVLQRIIDDPREAGKHFNLFLRNGGRVIIGEPRIIQIDRSKKFDPAEFIGKGWTIEEEDERSLELTELDITNVRFEHMLVEGETWVKGETKLERLKSAGNIRLDAKIFQTLWENQHLIPERWKEKTNGNTTFVCFDGTVLRDPGGYRYILYLDWYGGGWCWNDRWLVSKWDANGPSAVLAS